MTPAQEPMAVTLSCERCGSPLAPVGTHAQCEYCGHKQAVDLNRLAQWHRYQQEAFRLKASENAELGTVSQLNSLHGGRGPQSKNAMLILMACTSTPVVLSIGFMIAAMAAGLSNELVKGIASSILMIGFFVGVGGYFAWYYGGPRKQVRSSQVAQTATCPICGAQTAFGAGQVLKSCQYCGTNALPGTAMLRAGLDAAEQATRLARLERYRTERRMVSGYAQIADSTAAVYPWVLGISVGLPVVAAAIWATWCTVTGIESATPGVLAAFWILALTVIIGSAAYLHHRTKNRRQWNLALRQLAANLNGVSQRGSAAAMNWLDTFWACPFPVERLFVCSLGSSTVGRIRNYPALILINPKWPDDNSRGNAEVLLAAKFTSVPEEAELANWPPLETLRSRLDAEGYTIKGYGAGLHVSASPQRMDELRAAPERATILLGIADEMARLAATGQAQGVAPMPPP